VIVGPSADCHSGARPALAPGCLAAALRVTSSGNALDGRRSDQVGDEKASSLFSTRRCPPLESVIVRGLPASVDPGLIDPTSIDHVRTSCPGYLHRRFAPRTRLRTACRSGCRRASPSIRLKSGTDDADTYATCRRVAEIAHHSGGSASFAPPPQDVSNNPQSFFAARLSAAERAHRWARRGLATAPPDLAATAPALLPPQRLLR